MSTKKTSKRKASKKAATKKRTTKKATRRKATTKKTATKKRTAKRSKKKATKKRAPSKGGRPRTPQQKLDLAVAAYGDGKSVEDAAKDAGIGKRTLERELKRLTVLRADDADPLDLEMDPQAPSLDVARQGLAHAINALRERTPNHRSFATMQGAVQKWLGLVRRWEREEAASETPEQEERRLRKEEGEVAEFITQTVSAYEDEAREKGVCLWCGQDVDGALAAKLHGEAP